jgi:WD40 repeat protein
MTTAADNVTTIWDLDGKEAPMPLAPGGSPLGVSAPPVFSPDGRHVLTIQVGTAQVWELGGSGEPVVLSGEEHDQGRFQLRWPSGGDRRPTGTLRVWEWASDRKPQELPGHEGTVWSLAFSPDNRLVVSAGADRTARVWDLAGRRPPVVLRGHRGGS